MIRFLNLFKGDLKKIKKGMTTRRTEAVDKAITEFNAGLEISHNHSEELWVIYFTLIY